MFFSILLGLIFLLFLLHCIIRYGRIGRILNSIPGPKEFPIIGNLIHFMVDNGKLYGKKNFPT